MADRINRRDFLKKISQVGIGMVMLPGFQPVLKAHNQILADPLSKVLKVMHSDATIGFTTIRSDIVQIMMDEGIKNFTGIGSIGEAWKSIFPGITTSSIIGIKVNCIYSLLSSHPAVVNALINSLVQMNFGGTFFPENNIIVWDRTNWELTSAGYTINIGTTGARCYGTNQSGVGYDNAATAVVDSVTIRFSKILSQTCDFLIDVPVVKDHGGAGATFSMKNFYGAVDNPGGLHNNYCNPAIAQLNNTSLVKDKTKIVVCDALWGIYNGGPGSGWTAYAFTPNSLYFATDRVAVDYVLLQMLDAERIAHGRSPVAPYTQYIQTANDLGVGTNNPAQIQLVELINPTPSRIHDWKVFSS